MTKALSMIVLSFACWLATDAHGQTVSRNRVAAHKLGFSGATLSIREDYSHTRWPVAHRTLELRGPDGRAVHFRLHDGGASELTSLSLYHRDHMERDATGRPIGGEFILIGARDCVTIDPVFQVVAACAARPPCEGQSRAGLNYMGRSDWANGFDPPKGEFQFGWRFLPLEDGTEDPHCDQRSD